jgi:hypothetical protein
MKRWDAPRTGRRSIGPQARSRKLSSARSLATAAALGAAVFLLTAQHARATTYKWVDDQGIVHYTDKMPPEAVNKGSVELNKQGIPIKKNDPALTPEQRKARDADEERQRQATQQRSEIERRDRALLQSYTTEGEIDLARKRALGTIDAQVQSAQAYSAQLTKRKQQLDTQRAASSDKTVSPVIERELTNIDEELAKQADLVAGKRREADTVNARYDADKQRWQTLKAISEANAAAAASGVAPVTGGAPGTSPAGGKK